MGREGGVDGNEVAHYFGIEAEARTMLRRMLDAVPPEWAKWAQMVIATTSRTWPRYVIAAPGGRGHHDDLPAR